MAISMIDVMNGETINPVMWTLLGLLVIAIAFFYFIQRSKLESERVEKGEKLLELKASMSDDRSFRHALLLLFVLFLIAIGITILSWLSGKSIELWLIVYWFWIPAFIILMFMKRTYEIYEKGIKIMVRFYPWDTFKGYTIKNRQVLIYSRSFWSGRVVLPDEDGKVKKVIMEYLEPYQKY
jgi:hypothetical protein